MLLSTLLVAIVHVRVTAGAERSKFLLLQSSKVTRFARTSYIMYMYALPYSTLSFV